jgi:3-methylcrotonyl-CoA carboxylase alpha subunit
VSFGDATMSLELPAGVVEGTALWRGQVSVFAKGHTLDFIVPDPFTAVLQHSGTSKMTAPMPGLVKLVHAKIGQKVAKGDALLVLEAMKMEHVITAPRDGVLAEIAVAGSQVSDGTVLAVFEGE